MTDLNRRVSKLEDAVTPQNGDLPKLVLHKRGTSYCDLAGKTYDAQELAGLRQVAQVIVVDHVRAAGIISAEIE